MRGSTTIGKRLLLVGFKRTVMPVRILKTRTLANPREPTRTLMSVSIH
jgi:hypothetical protein